MRISFQLRFVRQCSLPSVSVRVCVNPDVVTFRLTWDGLVVNKCIVNVSCCDTKNVEKALMLFYIANIHIHNIKNIIDSFRTCCCLTIVYILSVYVFS